MAADIDNVLLQSIAEIEELAEEILSDKKQIISLDQKRQKTREAVRYSRKLVVGPTHSKDRSDESG